MSDRCNAALLLHKTPEEIDAMPADDVRGIFARYSANQEIKSRLLKRK